MSNFFPQLTELVEAGELVPLLWSAHRPCRRLILFNDFCQEVMLRAVQYHESFRGETRSELLGWLRSIGQQLMLTHLRRSRQLMLPPLPDDLVDSRCPAPADELGQAEEDREHVRWLVSALAALDPDDRELLVRHYFRQEPWKKIAHDLGIAPNTLAQRHLRLLRRLRALRKK